ncbi:MAG: transposase DNA-binding-containing protein [Chloroflexota bacterium]
MLTTAETNLDEQWAALEFADVELRDARLNRRCQELAVAHGLYQPGV